MIDNVRRTFECACSQLFSILFSILKLESFKWKIHIHNIFVQIIKKSSEIT